MESASSADRNLLFGILALQSGVITEARLLDAMRKWTAAKHKRLNEILVEQGALTVQQAELMDPIVDAQFQIHHGSYAAALASQSMFDRVAATMRRSLADPDVQIRVHSSLSESTNDTLAKSTTAAGQEALQFSGSRYIPRKLHAQGGLGAVYCATDTELNREVALKEIRPEFSADRESRARFVLEAEVTGGLEHPGIVPVYGLGNHDDGRPFYAMRFIRGESLREAIDEFHQTVSHASPDVQAVVTDGNEQHEKGQSKSSEFRSGESSRTLVDSSGIVKGPDYHSLAFRKLLGRFIDVCQAVSFAHSRGVLHRDLKPGNIMLGKYGETLVVDWGLAKVLGRSETTGGASALHLHPSSGSEVSPTAAGQAMGSPAYMPPEQAAGRLNQLGPASDVYSLGATLYHLLTGQAPFRSNDPAVVLSNVESGTFLPPRSLQPGIPISLQAVCLKAMSLRPGDRYVSVHELLEEVERYLADEPVSACQESFVVRSRRWIRKHQTLATTTAAVVLVTAIGLGVFSSVVSDKNRDLAQAKQTAEDNAKSAEEQRDIALANANAAREQSQLALSTLTAVIQDIQGGLRDVPGSGEVRRRLLLTSLEKLKSVSDTWLLKASTESATWLALIQMGDVVTTFGTETSSPEMTGVAVVSSDLSPAVELAESYFQRAFSISEAIVRESPGDPEKQRNHAISYVRLGNTHVLCGKTDEALKEYQNSRNILLSLIEANPRDEESMRDFSIACEQLGKLLLTMGDLPGATEQFSESVRVCRQLRGAHADNVILQQDLAGAYSCLGDALQQQGRHDEAYENYSSGFAIVETLVQSAPQDLRKLRELSVFYNKLGNVQISLNQADKAIEAFQHSLKLCRKLAESDGKDFRNLRDLSTTLERVGMAYDQLGDAQLAYQHFSEMHEIKKRLSDADQSNTVAKREVSVAHIHLGDVALKLQRPEEALRHFEADLTLCRELALADPSNRQSQRDLSLCVERLGNCFLAMERLEDALVQYEEFLKSCRRFADLNSDDLEAQHDLSVANNKLGDLYLKLMRPKDALPRFVEALTIRRHLVEQSPDNPARRRDLVVSLFKTGSVHMALDDFANAAQTFSDGAEAQKWIMEHGSERNPSTRQLDILQSKAQVARDAMIATGDFETVLQQPNEKLVALLGTRMSYFVNRERFQEAAEAAVAMTKLQNAENAEMYDAACVLALCASSNQADLSDEQKARRDELVRESLAALKLAIEKGWSDFAHLQQDPDLEILRELPEFKALVPSEPVSDGTSNPQ